MSRAANEWDSTISEYVILIRHWLYTRVPRSHPSIDLWHEKKAFAKNGKGTFKNHYLEIHD